ncbi:MAG: hypothetical protein JWP97_5237 [Labilithrix sp.]|nr:hypothetical protein [Labilithrix sp.]
MASRSNWLLTFTSVAAAAWIAACGEGRPDVGGTSGSTLVTTGGGGGEAGDGGTSHAAAGAACATPGETKGCSAIHQVVDGEVLCSIGFQRCEDDHTWSACQPERIVTKAMPALSTQGYGDPGNCADPCTPDCLTTVDTPGGLALPGGLNNDGGGVTLNAVPPPPNTCTGLTISPANPTITVTGANPTPTQQFTAALVPAGCNPAAPTALFYTDKFDVAQMGTTAPGLLTVAVPVAGTVQVSAGLGPYTATTTATIKVDAASPSTAQPPPSGASLTNFGAELPGDPADANLEILYPYTETVLPMGLPAPLLQWRNNSVAATGGVTVTITYPAESATPAFTITALATESTTAPVPLRGAQPRYTFPQIQWQALEQTVHRNRAALGDKARIKVRRRVGTTTYLAKSVDVHIAPGQLKGRIYYNSYGTALVNNYSGAKQSAGGAFVGGGFGAATLMIPPGGAAPVVAAGFNGAGGCIVCHSASADGATLISANESYVARKYTFPGTPPSGGTSYSSNAALVYAGINPTSTRILSSAGAFSGDSVSRLYDINGALVVGSNVPSTLKAGFPSFAPDGSAVAFNFRGGSASPLSAAAADGTSVATMAFDGNKTFSGFRKLVTPAGGPSVWPGFLPAKEGVVYEVETRTTPNGGYGATRHDCECATYSGATGELWWVDTGASPAPVRLNRANGYDASGANGVLPTLPATGHAGYLGTTGPAGAGFYEQRYNYEPTVLPQKIGGYSWVIFTSRRMYGNVATINPYASDPRYDDISIDPTPKKLWVAAIDGSPTPGSDPSYPAFYLPGQELIAGNSRAVFALDACHPAAATGAPLTPANLCDSDLDCCNAPGTAACVLDPPPLGSPPVKHCVATSASVCRAVGESCLTTSNCCNAVSGGVCAAGVCATPPAYYLDQTMSRDFSAACLPGYNVRWGLFDWQSRTPGNSKIQFSAQTSDDGVTWSPASPLLFATASGPDVVAPNWATTGRYVSTALGQSPQGSPTNKKLRITMALQASSDRGSSPTLIDWRQSILCVPSE